MRRLRGPVALLTAVLTVVLSAAAGPAAAESGGAPGPEGALRHAVWIGHGWVNGTPVQTVPDLLAHLTANGVGVLLVNTGRLDETGRIEDPATTLERWPDQVAAWERSQGRRLELWAWVSGKTFRTNLGDEQVQANIAGEARRLMAVQSPSGRGFDGIVTDIEPVGLDPDQYAAYIRLVDRIRAVVGDDRIVGVATPRYSPNPTTVWFWGPEEFHRMAQHADVMVANTYNSGLQGIMGVTGEDYMAWIAAQTQSILTAVSGQAGPPARPAPRPGFRLFLSAPAYPPLVHENGSISHDPGIENTRYAIRGIRQGVRRLRDAGAPAASYLGGITLYGHTDGTGADGYATLPNDWAWWGQEMNAPDAPPGPLEPRHTAWLGLDGIHGQPELPAEALLDRLHAQGVRHLMVNTGRLDSGGRIPAGTDALQQLVTRVQGWERSRGERMILWAWVPGDIGQTDISRPQVQEQIAAQADRILSVRGPGGRRLEGIALAFWPVGRSPDVFRAYADLVDRIHRTVGWQTAVGVVAPQYSAEPATQYQWGPAEFYYMARRSDFVVMSPHSSGLSAAEGATAADYAAWVEGQVQGILAAVSGEHWTPARPGPREHFRVFYTLQAYPPADAGPAGLPGSRDPAIESSGTATSAVQAALAALGGSGHAGRARLVQGMVLPARAAASRKLLLERLQAEPNRRSLYESLVMVETELGQHQDLDTFVSGQKVPWDVRPLIESGHTLVPVRKLAEALGATVAWDEAQRAVTVSRGRQRIRLVIGAPTARVDGAEVPLAVPARIVAGGRTVIPLRFAGERLGLSVAWLEPSRTIVLTEGPLVD